MISLRKEIATAGVRPQITTKMIVKLSILAENFKTKLQQKCQLFNKQNILAKANKNIGNG